MVRRLLILLTTVVLAVLVNWQDEHFVSAGQKSKQQADAQEQILHSTLFTFHSADNSRHLEATLSDATNLYRVCSSRPQRLLPTQGSKTERSNSPSGGFVRRNSVKPLQFLHDSRRRLETAPFCMSASCHYYVIALRHIIR
ncbi:MAG: hypothetical protein IJT98_06970 [Prevotella sp.]|nr:hypothetical protein [Prevotella sp.]